MSSFPRAARLLAVFAIAVSSVVLPSGVGAATVAGSASPATGLVQPRVVPGQVLVSAASS